MKTKLLIASIIVIVFMIITSCNTSETKDENPINQNFSQCEIPNVPPTEEQLTMIDSSILAFEVREGGNLRSSYGHCCLYCNRKGFSFLILPYHVFSCDSTKKYNIVLTNFKGERIEASSFRCLSFNPEYDAMVFVTRELEKIPTVSEKYQVTKEVYVGDSVVLWTPFNARNVTRKAGILCADNQVKMDMFVGEPGDSGGLVIGKNGIIGMVISTDDTGVYVTFVPIDVFEQLYQGLITDEEMSL